MISFFVGTKNHNKRVCRLEGNLAVNTKPGDIVDSAIVRHDVPEFFQQSHFPLRGVPKLLQLAILVDELEMLMSRIQQLILALSNAHQITACPTSLPLPIFIAHETAKRGLNVYNELYSLRFPKNLKEQPTMFALELKTNQLEMFDFEQFTNHLGYAKTCLADTRYNA